MLGVGFVGAVMTAPILPRASGGWAEWGRGGLPPGAGRGAYGAGGFGFVGECGLSVAGRAVPRAPEKPKPATSRAQGKPVPPTTRSLPLTHRPTAPTHHPPQGRGAVTLAAPPRGATIPNEPAAARDPNAPPP
ncbi:hypothetical protein GCM10010307_11380 [Streptomyces vastus]|uniref:Uncharacterized protein n=1 Tax=Streptomyces vastus TaxID=285451 RepID=A0ABN3QF28_9ACTN